MSPAQCRNRYRASAPRLSRFPGSLCILLVAAVSSGFAQGAQRVNTANPATDFSAIQHFVFIVKENRTFDNLFGTFPGANGATSGTISTGQIIPLGHDPDAGPRDLATAG